MAAGTSDELIEVVGRWLADRVEADAHVFCRLDPLTALWSGASDAGYPADSCSHFKAEAFLRSTYADFGQAAQIPQRVRRLSKEETPDDPYTEIYFGGFGYSHELHASFATGGQGYGYLTVARRGRDFSADATRLLEMAVPPVTGALRRLLAKEMLEAVPGEAVGLLVVDAKGDLHGLNAVGHELVAVHERRDRARSHTVLGVIAELTRRELATPGRHEIPRVLYVCPETHRRFRLIVERIQSPRLAAETLVVAEPVRALDSVELLRAAGLTEREAEAALITLRGFKSVEGAAALQISEHTFLGHLKAVYKKLGVGSRGELAALLLSGM